MAIESLVHKQQIVFVGLRRMTDDRNLIIDGFRHWSQNLSGNAWDVPAIVAELVDYLGLGSAE